MIARSLMLVLLCAWVAPAKAAPARTWTDLTGKHQVEAEFIRLEDGKVHLRKIDGRLVALPLEKLSQADQQYVNQLVAKTSAGEQPDSQVSFAEQKLQFAVPDGWTVVKYEQKKNRAWCVLQERAEGQVKATVAIWAGQKFINDAPATARFKAGNTIAASIRASRQAIGWALGTPGGDPPKTRQLDGIKTCDYGGVSYVGTESTSDSISAFGLSTCRRPDGALTVGCACSPAAMQSTKQLLEKILGKSADLLGVPGPFG